jgi:hypothetical protein
MTENKVLNALGNIIRTKVLNHERIIILLVTLGLLIKYLKVQFSGLIDTFLLSSVSIIYFLSAYSTHEESNSSVIDLFVYKICAFGSAVSIIGILFIIQKWPNSKLMLIMGLSALVIPIIYILINNTIKPESKLFDVWLIIRIILLVIILATLFIDKLK